MNKFAIDLVSAFIIIAAIAVWLGSLIESVKGFGRYYHYRYMHQLAFDAMILYCILTVTFILVWVYQ